MEYVAKISEIATEFQLSGSLLSKHFGGAESWRLLTQYPDEKRLSTSWILLDDAGKCWKYLKSTLTILGEYKDQVPSVMTCSFRAQSLCKWVMLPRSSPAVRSTMELMIGCCGRLSTFYIDFSPMSINLQLSLVTPKTSSKFSLFERLRLQNL